MIYDSLWDFSAGIVYDLQITSSGDAAGWLRRRGLPDVRLALWCDAVEQRGLGNHSVYSATYASNHCFVSSTSAVIAEFLLRSLLLSFRLWSSAVVQAQNVSAEGCRNAAGTDFSWKTFRSLQGFPRDHKLFSSILDARAVSRSPSFFEEEALQPALVSTVLRQLSFKVIKI